MINNTDTNPKLTDTHVAELAIFTSKLSNLENEISIANKNLLVIKKDAEKAYKDKLYQEELLSETTKNVEISSARLVQLNAQIEESQSKLDFNTTQSQEVLKANLIKSTELNKKEEFLKYKEEDLNTKVVDFTRNYSDFLADKDIHKKNKEILKKAIDSIQ